jgi:hypothetical protein
MKSILCAVLALITVRVSAQTAIASFIGEMTVAGYEGGAAISYENKRAWRIGVFYQVAVLPQEMQIKTQNSFLGLVTSVPVAKSEKVNFHGVIRTGLVNRTFVVATPGLETTVRLGKNFSFGAGLSIRKTYPSALVKLSIEL